MAVLSGFLTGLFFVNGRDSVIRLSYGYKVPTNREQQIQEGKNMYYSNGNYEAFFHKG